MSGNSSGNLSPLGLGDVGAGQSWGACPLRKGHCWNQVYTRRPWPPSAQALPSPVACHGSAGESLFCGKPLRGSLHLQLQRPCSHLTRPSVTSHLPPSQIPSARAAPVARNIPPLLKIRLERHPKPQAPQETVSDRQVRMR